MTLDVCTLDFDNTYQLGAHDIVGIDTPTRTKYGTEPLEIQKKIGAQEIGNVINGDSESE